MVVSSFGGPFAFGTRSRANLNTCHPKLIATAELAIQIYDFSVIEGHRSLERQQELYADGLTEIDGDNMIGNHNVKPSRAMDLLPYPAMRNGVNVWGDHDRWLIFAGIVIACGAQVGARLRWGGDWNMDGSTKDTKFFDKPHFELLGD